MKYLLSCLVFLLAASAVHAQAGSADPARVPIKVIGDSIVGYLTLGVSRTADADSLLKGIDGLGPKRRNTIIYPVGGAKMRPREVYTPFGTIHQLYFEKDLLVLYVDSSPTKVPATFAAFKERFPGAKETARAQGWFEVQAQLSECIWMTAVFWDPGNELDYVSYAYTCQRP